MSGNLRRKLQNSPLWPRKFHLDAEHQATTATHQQQNTADEEAAFVQTLVWV